MKRRLAAGEVVVRASRVGDGLIIRAEGKDLRATVTLRGRHRCVALLENGIFPRREREEPEASCRIEEVA